MPTVWIFDTVNGNLRDSASFTWDPQFANGTMVGYFINQVLADDLDGLPGDEFVVVTNARRDYAIEGFGVNKPEIWIYQGGNGFQLDTPMAIIPITDSLPRVNAQLFHALISDFDGDGYPDLMSIGAYAQGTLMHVWFGDSTSPWDWTAMPDRTIDVTAVGLRSEVTHGDYDGDGLLDFAGTVLRDERFITHLFLSAGGKSIRDRSFSEADVDRAIYTDVFQTVPGPAPYLNDSSHRYAMLALKGPSRFEKGSDMLYFLSGGPHGPNATADAFWAPSRDGVASGPVANLVRPIPDCNGDHFDDLMIGDSKWWYSLFDYGIALVLAGTDSIPNDDPTVSVRSTGSGSAAERLTIYPNPARSYTSVEIPGSLRHRKGVVTILNVRGELVRRLDVPAGSDRLSLEVADLPEGLYLVRLSEEGSNETLEGLMIREGSGEQ